MKLSKQVQKNCTEKQENSMRKIDRFFDINLYPEHGSHGSIEVVKVLKRLAKERAKTDCFTQAILEEILDRLNQPPLHLPSNK